MNHSASSESRLAVVHGAARQLRAALLSGSLDDLAESIPALMDAAQHLRSVERRWAKDSGEQTKGLRGELEDLRMALKGAAMLVENGAALEQGWARMLGAAIGYTA